MSRSVPAAATRVFVLLRALAALPMVPLSPSLDAQSPPPSVVDPNLAVRAVISGLNQPITMAFLGPRQFFVLEKASGRVLRVRDGAVQDVVLDLPVNSASERGLLGIALHPDFPGNPGVYLFWTESSTGADSSQLADVALLGNRVDRYEWNGSTLTHAADIIRLRAFQSDAGQPLRGNHNGGVLRFGPDVRTDGAGDRRRPAAGRGRVPRRRNLKPNAQTRRVPNGHRVIVCDDVEVPLGQCERVSLWLRRLVDWTRQM